MWFLSTSEMIARTKTPSRLLHLLSELCGCTCASHNRMFDCLRRSELRFFCCLSLQVLRERKCGYGILVSQVPKDTTEAFYSLRDPSEVNLSWCFLSIPWSFYPAGFVQSSIVTLICVCSSYRWWGSSIPWWDGRSTHCDETEENRMIDPEVVK